MKTIVRSTMTAEQHHQALAAEQAQHRRAVRVWSACMIGALVLVVAAMAARDPYLGILSIVIFGVVLCKAVPPPTVSRHELADVALIVETAIRAQLVGDLAHRLVRLLIAEQGYLLRVQAEEFHRSFAERLREAPAQNVLSRVLKLQPNQIQRVIASGETSLAPMTAVPATK